MPNTTIWRLDLHPPHCRLQVPPGAIVLSVGEPAGTHIPSIWFSVDPADARRVTRRFLLVRTGVHTGIDLNSLHLVGRVNAAPIQDGPQLTYHVFEVPREGD